MSTAAPGPVRRTGPSRTPEVVAALTPVVQEVLTTLPGPVDLEGLDVQVAGRRLVVRVAVDADGGVDLDAVALVSRAVSDAFDALDERDPSVFGGPYVLEVGSPGVDRPLTAARHWRRNRGRLVRVTLAAGGELVGRVGELVGPPDEPVAVRLALGDGSGAQRGPDVQDLALADVRRAVVQVEFGAAEGADGSDEEGPA